MTIDDESNQGYLLVDDFETTSIILLISQSRPPVPIALPGRYQGYQTYLLGNVRTTSPVIVCKGGLPCLLLDQVKLRHKYDQFYIRSSLLNEEERKTLFQTKLKSRHDPHFLQVVLAFDIYNTVCNISCVFLTGHLFKYSFHPLLALKNNKKVVSKNNYFHI